MSEFKQVLDIEKKYQKIISTANSKSETSINKTIDELKIKHDAMKDDLKNELIEELKKTNESLEKRGEKQIQTATQNAEQTKQTANIDKAVNYLLEEFKNGF